MTDISVGMNVMKVTINRPWFDPSIFSSSGNYVRLSGSAFSPGFDPDIVHDSQVSTTERNAKCRSASAYPLPAYPVAFLVAKDVTISLTNQGTSDHSAHNFLKDSSTTGVSSPHIRSILSG